MSIEAINYVWQNSPQSGDDLLMLLLLANYADEEGFSWAAQPTLARMTRQSQDNARRIIRYLESQHEIIVVQAGGKKTLFGATNGYYMVMPSLNCDSYEQLCQKLKVQPVPKADIRKRRGGVRLKEGGAGLQGAGSPARGGGAVLQGNTSLDTSLKRKKNSSPKTNLLPFAEFREIVQPFSDGVYCVYRGERYEGTTEKHLWRILVEHGLAQKPLTLEEFIAGIQRTRQKTSLKLNGKTYTAKTPELLLAQLEAERLVDNDDLNYWFGLSEQAVLDNAIVALDGTVQFFARGKMFAARTKTELLDVMRAANALQPVFPPAPPLTPVEELKEALCLHGLGLDLSDPNIDWGRLMPIAVMLAGTAVKDNQRQKAPPDVDGLEPPATPDEVERFCKEKIQGKMEMPLVPSKFKHHFAVWRGGGGKLTPSVKQPRPLGGGLRRLD